MTSAFKNIIVEFNKDENNEDRYEIWAMKIQYVLEALEVLTHVSSGPRKETQLNIEGTMRPMLSEKEKLISSNQFIKQHGQ